MQVLVSDSSVLIELSKRDLLDRMFQLRFPFAVPDLLFNEELIDLGGYDRRDLVRMGLRVEGLDPDGVATAIAYQSRRRALSLVDCFALVLAHHHGHTLLTEDRRMRAFAQDEGIPHHDLRNPEAEKPGLGEIRAFASPFRMKNGPLGDDSLV